MKSFFSNRIFFTILLSTMAVFLTLSVSLAAEELFFHNLRAKDKKEESYVLRSNVVTINTKYVRKRLVREKGSIGLNLFDNVYLTAINESLKIEHGEEYIWRGRIVSDEGSQVIIMYNHEGMFANIFMRDEQYQIRPENGSVHAIRQISQCGFPGYSSPLTVDFSLVNHKDKAGEPEISDNGEIIDVLVVYTNAAMIAAGGMGNITGEIKMAVEVTNNACDLSGVNHRFNLVDSKLIDYDESVNMSQNLKRLRLPDDGYMDAVHSWRNDTMADVVVLFVDDLWSTTVGISYHMDEISTEFEQWAFAVMWWNAAVEVMAFAHETGHILGAHHDCYDCSINEPYNYIHGYVNVEKKWFTIMAYKRACTDNGIAHCRVINYFSNPLLTYQGASLGTSDGVCQANVAKTFNRSAKTVANFRCSTGDTATIDYKGSSAASSGCFVVNCRL
ncbi:MAG: M12 family metallo-peptidase [bacterium]